MYLGGPKTRICGGEGSGLAKESAIQGSLLLSTHVTQHRTRHPGFPAVQLRLTCDQICAGSESLHVKYGAKEKREMEILGIHVNMRDHRQATSTGLST